MITMIMMSCEEKEEEDGKKKNDQLISNAIIVNVSISKTYFSITAN